MTYDNREDQFYASDCRRNPDFEGINPEFVSETGPEVSFKRSKNPDNFWIWHGFSGILYKTTSATGTWPREHGKCIRSFWTLEKRIRQDKKNPGVLIELRKSTAIWDIAYLVGDGVITMDELEGFSEDLIDAVKLILGR